MCINRHEQMHEMNICIHSWQNVVSGPYSVLTKFQMEQCDHICDLEHVNCKLQGAHFISQVKILTKPDQLLQNILLAQHLCSSFALDFFLLGAVSVFTEKVASLPCMLIKSTVKICSTVRQIAPRLARSAARVAIYNSVPHTVVTAPNCLMQTTQSAL